MTIFAENKWRSDMTKEELIERLDDIEWEDSEVKSAPIKLPIKLAQKLAQTYGI